jgi:Putative auto-transporter adhesin, head GIN domain
MKKTPNLVILFLSLLTFNGCDLFFFDCIEGNNDIRTESRNVQGFDEIVNEGSFDVYVTYGKEYEVIIEAEGNLIPYISTRVRDDRLLIDNVDMRCLRPNRPMKLFITTPVIETLVLEGSGLVSCDTFHIQDLRVELAGSGKMEATAESSFMDVVLSGSGNIELHGSSVQSEFLISGSGSIHSYDLEQEECVATISGSGNMYVKVNNLLDVLISGSGDIFYRGTPDVRTRITGSGSVINDN